MTSKDYHRVPYSTSYIQEHKVINKVKSESLFNKDSIIFDCGGFKGEYTDDIIHKYNCNVYIYEPIKEFSDRLINKYKNNKKIHVINKAIYKRIGKEKFYLGGISNEGSSLIKEKYNVGKEIIVETTTIDNELNINKIDKLDLIKLNVEGSELDILENTSIDTLKKIKQIQLSAHFNKGIPNYTVDRFNKLKEYLIKGGLMLVESYNYNKSYVFFNVYFLR